MEKHIRHTFFWCPVLVDEKKLGMKTGELINALRERGIETRHRYQKPLYKQKLLLQRSAYPKGFPFNSKHYSKKIDYGKVYLRNAEKLAGKIIGLPNHSGLSRAKLDYIVGTLARIR